VLQRLPPGQHAAPARQRVDQSRIHRARVGPAAPGATTATSPVDGRHHHPAGTVRTESASERFEG
jgi:hypothetical protein